MVNNKFYWFQSAIDKETCQKIINLGLSQLNNLKLEGKSIQGLAGYSNLKSTNLIPKNDLTTQQLKNKNLSEKDVYVRDSQICWLDYDWLYELIQYYMFKANELAGWNFDLDFSEVPQFTVYENSGFYSWHNDSDGDWNSIYKSYIHGVSEEKLSKDGDLPYTYTRNKNLIGKVRKLSFTLNLTEPENYEGGNLLFDMGEHSENKIIQCNEIRTQGSLVVFPSFIKHCVTPVTKGTRYSLVNWMCGRPFK